GRAGRRVEGCVEVRVLGGVEGGVDWRVERAMEQAVEGGGLGGERRENWPKWGLHFHTWRAPTGRGFLGWRRASMRRCPTLAPTRNGRIDGGPAPQPNGTPARGY